MSCFRKPDRPSRFAPTQFFFFFFFFFFCHNLHSVKIGNLRSVSQAPFRLHSIVSVQSQHGKTGAQVNHVVFFFFFNVRIGDCSDIIDGFFTFTKYKGQFCNSVPSISLFEVPKRRIPSCLCTQIHSNNGKKQLPCVCKQTSGLSDLDVYYVIILAGIISYINYIIFTLAFYLSFFNIFSNTKIINSTKLKTEKIDCQSYFGDMQGSVMRALMYTY